MANSYARVPGASAPAGYDRYLGSFSGDERRKLQRRLQAAISSGDPGQIASLKVRYPGLNLGSFGLGGGIGTTGGAPRPTYGGGFQGTAVSPTGSAPRYDLTGDMARPSGGEPAGAPWGTGTIQAYIQAALQGRQQVVGQQAQLLSQYGQTSRQAALQASPEFASAAQYYQSRASGGIPQELLGNYQDLMRQAQAARGFTGGSGPAGQEAARLTGLSEQIRAQAVQGQMGLGQQLLGLGGFTGVPQMDLGTVGSIGLGTGSLAQQQEALFQQVLAGQQQSALAQQMWEQTMGLLQSGAQGGGSVLGAASQLAMSPMFQKDYYRTPLNAYGNLNATSGFWGG